MSLRPCIVCGSSRFESTCSGVCDYEYGLVTEIYGYAKCLNCGLLALTPMPDEDVLAGYYPAEYANIHEESVRLHAFLMNLYYNTVHAFYKRILPEDAHILDVGCAAGHFIGYLQEREPGWEVMGVDLNTHACKAAAAKGRRVLNSDFESFPFDEGPFDMIILSHLIEHVLDPGAMIVKSHNLLRPGGYLYIETPNTACVDLRIFGKYWGGLHYPRHTYIFSRRNIASLLNANGFPEIRFGFTLNMFGWALSLQNLLVDRFSLFTKNGRIGAYPLIMLAFSPLVLIQKFAGNAGGMRILAKRRDG